MRVGIIALLQESNTFVGRSTTLDQFRQDCLLTGDAIRHRFAAAHHEIGGFLAGLAAARIEAVPLFAARALPYGPLSAETYAQLLERMWRGLEAAGPLDGLLVAAHGATVSASHPDVDGHWLHELRGRVGPELPIVGTLDPHANLSRPMVDACHALIAYRTNPHTDQRSRGAEAANLLVQTLRGEVLPTQAAAWPPVAINIQAQATARSPCRPFYDQAARQRTEPGVLSNSILLGFPYADVREMGSATLVVTDNDRPRAERLAHELARHLWDRRSEFLGSLVDVDRAMAEAAALEPPVCLLDMGDNVGGGAPGDGTCLAHALCRQRIAPALVCLFDPQSVVAAQSLGVGNRGRLRVGGQTAGGQGTPLEETFAVERLHSGRFAETAPRHGGFTDYDQGPTAIVRSDDGLTVILTSRRMVPFSLSQLTSCGLDVADFRAVVVKGVHAPLAAYAPVCPSYVHVNTPGITCADLSQLAYQFRRRPLYPFEAEADWNALGTTEESP